MKNRKSKLISDKRRMEPLGVKSRDTNQEAGDCLISNLSFHESRPATIPVLGLLCNNPVFNLELV